jgi:PKD repeat protein
MKKIMLVLLAAMIAMVTNCAAQDSSVTCSAAFDCNFYPSGAYFNALRAEDSLTAKHTWNFGDGTELSTNYAPMHSYTHFGMYWVSHVVRKLTTGGVVVCEDSSVQLVNYSCIIRAGLTFYTDTFQRHKVHFFNNSYSNVRVDSVVWNFGDGTYSDEVNPVHQYTSPGIFNVCLTVRNSSCYHDTCMLIEVLDSVDNGCGLAASFTASQDSTMLHKINFINSGTSVNNVDTVQWSFGDGSSSSELNPSHTFPAAGIYNVCLRLIKIDTTGGQSCTVEYCRPVNVVEGCYIYVDFIAKNDSSNPEELYTYSFEAFTNGVNIGDSLWWDFGDGTSPVKDILNPVHSFEKPGYYQVCLTLKQHSPVFPVVICSTTVCKSINAVPVCNTNVQFSWHADSLASNKLLFSNQSQGADSTAKAEWSFGDGNFSHDWNAEHVYSSSGYYNVCLRITQNDSCIQEYCSTVYVDSTTPAPCSLTASFISQQDSLQLNKFYFINMSAASDQGSLVTWSFGDGSGSNDMNPVHMFTATGLYNVCLQIVKDSACSSTTCMVVKVLATDSCLVKADFTISSEENNPYKIRFNNTSTNAALIKSVKWTFGDGHSSNKLSPAHQYTAPGKYYVCLRIEASNGCTNNKCDSFIINKPAVNCDSSLVKFVYQRDSYIPNKIYFFAAVTKPGMRYNWSISSPGLGAATATLTEPNPSYVFSDTGSYWVCLRTINERGCTNEYCERIIITDTTPAAQCVLQAYPNPVHNNLFVNLELTKPEQVQIAVFNMQNILVQQQTEQGLKGNNKLEINVQKLLPGFYVLRLVYGNKNCYAKFQKL